METKAQKAALGMIKMEKERLIEMSRTKLSHANIENLEFCLGRIKNIVEEYGMDGKQFTDALQELYDSLMEHQHYEQAAYFAKKYNL